MAGAASGTVVLPIVGTVAGGTLGIAVAFLEGVFGGIISAYNIGHKYDACYNTARIHYIQAQDKCN